MGKWEDSGYLRNYCNRWPENLKVQTTNSVNEGRSRPRYQVSVYRTIGLLVEIPWVVVERKLRLFGWL